MKAEDIPYGRAAKLTDKGDVYILRFSPNHFIKIWLKANGELSGINTRQDSIEYGASDCELLPETTEITLRLDGKNWEGCE